MPENAACLSKLFVLGLVAGTCLGQSNPPAPTTRYLVNVIQLKPELADEWLDLQKNEVNPAMKKSGVEHVTVLRTVLGNPDEVIRVRPLSAFAEGDGQNAQTRVLGPEAAVRLRTRLRRCIVSVRQYTVNQVNALNVLPSAGTTPAVWEIYRVHVLPGKGRDLESYVASDILPALKKAQADGKIAGFLYFRSELGTASNEVFFCWLRTKLGDLDRGNLFTLVLPPDATPTARMSEWSTLEETTVARRLADLSF